nr:MAG TPA: hypothetical protein [Caudoviricetes sp.]
MSYESKQNPRPRVKNPASKLFCSSQVHSSTLC